MIGKIVFAVAIVLFGASLFLTTIMFGEGKTLSGVTAFIAAIRYGTAGLFSPSSLSDFVTCFLALMSAAANFVFVFWAMLVFSPTKVTSLKWFWWLSLVFIVAAAYTGVLVILDDRATLMAGYYCWLAALILMLIAPVVRRFERKREVILARRQSKLATSQ